VPDNLKAGITKPSRYEPGVNRTYQDLADHYGFVVLPARVRRPRDKAKVEAAVGIVSRFVLGKLRNRRFFSLAELNDAVRDCVTKINAKMMKNLKQSRNDLFASLHRPALKRLPGERYQYAEWKRCTVAPDYHVEVDDHYYSVPFGLLRETVEARFTDGTVEVLSAGKRTADDGDSVAVIRMGLCLDSPRFSFPIPCERRLGLPLLCRRGLADQSFSRSSRFGGVDVRFHPIFAA
jgi:transposase